MRTIILTLAILIFSSIAFVSAQTTDYKLTKEQQAFAKKYGFTEQETSIILGDLGLTIADFEAEDITPQIIESTKKDVAVILAVSAKNEKLEKIIKAQEKILGAQEKIIKVKEKITNTDEDKKIIKENEIIIKENEKIIEEQKK